MKPRTRLKIWIFLGFVLALAPLWSYIFWFVAIPVMAVSMQHDHEALTRLIMTRMAVEVASVLLVGPIGVVIVLRSALKLGRLGKEVVALPDADAPVAQPLES